MPADLAAATTFVHANARLLDRHRLAGDRTAVLAALRAYGTPDGGFGHALEPDVRDPAAQPAAVLHALEILDEIDALDGDLADGALAWLARVAHDDGSIPFVLPTSADHPHAPWMAPNDEPSFLTLAIVGLLDGRTSRWLDRAREWCWARVEDPARLEHYWVKFGLVFLDHVADADRARAAIDGLRGIVGADGTIPVAGGTEGEHLSVLDFSPTPGLRSRALFTDEQARAALDDLEAGQYEDGGWDVDYLKWSPGQALEWRGRKTVETVALLRAHSRLRPA
ncbi:prenyltransferase/squalene oxidase repeat-containing protein [Jatrophihabitans fulvus]